jgi:2-polyprenyl-3-methyl-5-hydroxy-6-metoxy-1,4-benzoquinol methylase
MRTYLERLAYKHSDTVTCPFCGNQAYFAFSAKDWNQHSSQTLFKYFRCKSCELVFLHPVPADTSSFYVNEQFSIPEKLDEFPARVGSQRWKLDLVRSHLTGPTLLEIGPATGEFATVAKDAGLEVTLIEMDDACCAFLRDKLGHTVIKSSDPSVVLAGGPQYDAICLWQSIEHIPQFWTIIDKLAGALRPGGICVISTPNPVSFQAKLMGRRWPHADAPRHLYLIPPRWITQTASTRGLRPVIMTTRDEGSLGLNYYGWFLWVRNLSAGFLSERRISRLAKTLAKTFARYERREGAGCSYVAILKKSG